MTWQRHHYVACFALGVIALTLLIGNLSNPLPWNDEATVLLAGKQVLATGSPYMWDGNNLLGYRNGAGLDEDLHFVYQPAPIYLSAFAQLIFGEHTSSLRIVNIIIALAALCVLAAVLRRELAAKPYVAILAIALLALQPPFLLYMRQATYYAAFLLANLAFYACLREWMRRRGSSNFWLAGALACALLSFFFQLIGIAWIIACGAVVLAENWRSLDKKRWLLLISTGAAFSVCVLGYVFASGVLNADLSVYDYQRSWPIRKLATIVRSYAITSELDMLPWPLAILALFYAATAVWHFVRTRARAGSSLDPYQPRAWPPLLRHLALGLAGIIMIALVSPEAPALIPRTEIRYRQFLMPFFCIAAAITIWNVASIRIIGRPIAVVLAGLMMFTNYLTYPVVSHAQNGGPSVDLIDHIKEIYGNQVDPMHVIVNVLHERSEDAERPRFIALETGGSIEIAPLLWLLGDKFRWCCQIDETSSRIKEVRELDASYLVRADPEFDGAARQIVPQGKPVFKFDDELFIPEYVLTQRRFLPELTAIGYVLDTAFPVTHNYAYRRPEPPFHIYGDKSVLAFNNVPGQVLLLKIDDTHVEQ